MPKLPDPEDICNRVLEAAGHSAPPTDLEAVCSLWSGLNILEEDLEKEGYLIPLGVHGAEILIRRRDPLTRKKFTLAHELGHWTLANLVADRVSFCTTSRSALRFRSDHKRGTPEEAWCNQFAACLLMPSKDINSYLDGPTGVDVAGRIASGHSVFQVSAEAFLSRITEQTPISVFEVVHFEGNPKIRRRFVSKHQRKSQVEHTINKFLDALRTNNDLSMTPVQIENYQIQAVPTLQSRYTLSWLVSAMPVSE